LPLNGFIVLVIRTQEFGISTPTEEAEKRGFHGGGVDEV
jgi:hypothetical protein